MAKLWSLDFSFFRFASSPSSVLVLDFDFLPELETSDFTAEKRVPHSPPVEDFLSLLLRFASLSSVISAGALATDLASSS